MPKPIILSIKLKKYGGLHLEVCHSHNNCEGCILPHCHLKLGEESIGILTTLGNWFREPEINDCVKKEAIELNEYYSPIFNEVYKENHKVNRHA